MASFRDDFSLTDFLKWLERKVDLVSPLSDEFCLLRLKVRLLKVFFSCGGKHNNIKNRRLQDLLVYIRAVFQSVDLDIRRCKADLDMKFSSTKVSEAFGVTWTRTKIDIKRRCPMNLVDLLSSVQQRLELLKPHIHEVYTILSNSSSRSTFHGDSESAMLNIGFLEHDISVLLKNNAQMVAPVKEELEATRKNLESFRFLLGFTTKRCSKLGKLTDLIIHAEFLANKISCLLYMCSFKEKMNDEMKMNLSSELNNLTHAQPHVRQIYIKALKASKLAKGDSAVVDQSDLHFLHGLENNILQLPGTKLSFVASQILSLHKELEYLTIALAMYTWDELIKHCKIRNHFVELISAVIADMGCLIYSLHNNEQTTDEANELKRAVSDLQNIIKSVKEDARKAYDTVVPESLQWKTKFRITNAQGMMESLMRVSGESAELYGRFWYFRTPFHSAKVLQKEMQSLIGTFSNLTLKQQLEYREHEIQMTRLNDIRIVTKNLMLSILQTEVWPVVWTYNLCLFVIIEEIKMIKKDFRYLQNKMHDTSTSMTHRRMNPQRKETMIDYAQFSKDEPERTRKQLINGSNKPHYLPISVAMHGIEDHLDLICPRKDEVKALRLKAGFLKIFLSCKGMWHIEDGNLKVLLTHINNVFQSVDQDHRKLWLGLNIQTSPKEVWCLPMNMDCLLSSVLSRLQLLEPNVQGAYAILSKSSIFVTDISDEALMEILIILLKNIEVLLKCNKLVAPLKEEFEVQKSLRFLRNFLGFTMKRWSKLGKLKDLLIHSEFLVGKISCLLYLCCNSEKMNDQMVSEMKMHLSSELQKFSPAQPCVREIYVKALKASKSEKGNSNFIVLDEFVLGFLDSLGDILKLSNNNLCFIASNKEQILSFLEELKFLTTFFTMDRSLEQHSQRDQISASLFEHINAMIIDLGCVIYMVNDDENNEKMTRELNKKVSDLVASFMVAKEDIRKCYDLYVPMPLRSDFPRTDGQGYIGSLFRNLNELLNAKPDLVAPLKYHIEIVRNELMSLREDFGKTADQPSQCDELQSQWTHFLDIAYQTEFVIDSFLAGVDSIYSHKLGLFDVLEEIKTIKIDLKAVKNKMTDDTLMQKASQMSFEANFPRDNEILSSKERPRDEKSTNKLEIFEEEAKKIREQLTAEGSKNLIIVSIVGMPGVGKTTLADSMFQHSSVTYHFHVRARYSVSQVLDKRRLLLEILQQFPIEGKQQGSDDDVGDLEQKLKQRLMGRRYLILLDDIWNIQHWNDIKSCFPNDRNGSRIIFTSRFEDIASQTGLESRNYHLSPLSEEMCWKMLKKKLFGDGKCHQEELKIVGREIAAKCKGLPLTVDLIAGVLQVQERKNWKEVVKSLVPFLLEDPQGQCRKVLELSYQNLPDDLKPCFLYFASFPEDANMPTRDLILLWIAEGFVQLGNDELRSLEDVAKDILNNLISRSLVIVSRRGPLGGVDESRVHDLLHEFAVAKAQEENFLLKIEGKAGNRWQQQYRLCIYPDNWLKFLKSNPCGPRTRALINSNGYWDNFRLNFNTFKLLRVLYIPIVHCQYCPEMFTLIHLRLLVISSFGYSDTRDIISNIHKLWNLETFIMNQVGYTVIDDNLLLDKICNMVRLRHFQIDRHYIRIRYLSEELWQKATFSNLRTLYSLKASCEEDIEKILKLMPNLVELKAIFHNPDEGCYPFPELDFLEKLESLELKHQHYYEQPLTHLPSFPPNLKRLVLKGFGLPWTEISEIGNLKYLEVFELKREAFTGPKWDMIDGQFPKLKYLSLSYLDIEEWNASENHLSCLEQLHVTWCWKLKELPFCLEEISTLRAIKLVYCTKEVKNSAKRIKEEQDQIKTEELVVDIKY